MAVLAGDIGGTQARLALFDEVRGTGEPLRRSVYESPDFGGLEPVVLAFLETVETTPRAACFGIAGPVVEGASELPNLGWAIDRRRLAEAIGIERTRIINDFDAVGWGLPLVGPSRLAVLQEGVEDPDGPLALIGAGTGLGEGIVVRDDPGHRVLSSEGGHADFAPRTARELELLRHLRERYPRVSVERVVSGPGILEIYRFLVERGGTPEARAVREALEAGGGPEVLSRHALAGTDGLAAQALDLFVSAYGAAAGNLALTVHATGGVYVAGGIAPDILPLLTAGGFMEAFRAKGRLSWFLERIPVRVVLDEDVGLRGAAEAARRGLPHEEGGRPGAGRSAEGGVGG